MCKIENKIIVKKIYIYFKIQKMPAETNKGKTQIEFAKLLAKYRENCKKQVKIDEINLQKEKEDFELEWSKAGLQIFRK